LLLKKSECLGSLNNHKCLTVKAQLSRNESKFNSVHIYLYSAFHNTHSFEAEHADLDNMSTYRVICNQMFCTVFQKCTNHR